MDDKIITEYDIQALVDNQLDGEAERRVQALLRDDPRLQKRYADLQSQKDLLNQWWQDKKRQF